MKPLRKKSTNLAKFEAEKTYHVYNRTNNKEPLFRDEYDYKFFLDRYRKYLEHFVDTYCYCLPINHFHSMLQVKPEEEIYLYLNSLCREDLTSTQKKFLEVPIGEGNMHDLIKGQLHRLFTAYAKYFNQRYQRKGNLFYRPYKRIEINSEVYFSHLVYYIHANPVKHEICEDFTTYPWSSYQLLLNGFPTFLKRDELLKWFGGKKDFLEYHHSAHLEFLQRSLYLEV